MNQSTAPIGHSWGDLSDDRVAATLLEETLAEVDGHVEFADARLVECEELRLYHSVAADADERREHNLGIGVRVLVNGAWGFASRPLTTGADARRAARQALTVALAGAGTENPVSLPPREGTSGSYITPVTTDPFAVDDADRHALLAGLITSMSAPSEVRDAQAGVNAKRQHRHYADTEGSRQHQHLIESGAMMIATAADDYHVQRRSFPNSFHGNTGGAGWEFVLGLDMPGNAARVGEEAAALLTAPVAPAGTADLLVGAQQVALQIHESCGHALELDRMLGDERNFAGTSFISVQDVGQLRYGSPAVNITSDPTVPGTRGTFAYDDEGTPAVRTPLIAEGIVVDTLSTRDAAARAGLRVTGAARSDGWAYLPVCFSTHVHLEPGSGSLDELLDRLGDGYYLDDNRSWSIDNQRLNFQFGTEVAYEVRGGQRRRLLKNFSYGGVTPRFWGAVEAVGGPAEVRNFGYPCGKGEPKQWGFLSHGAAPMIVRDQRIGVA